MQPVAMNSDELSQAMFVEYPDVMDVKQASTLLGVSTKTVYKVIRDGSLSSLKVGREFRILKINVLRYLGIFYTHDIISPKS